MKCENIQYNLSFYLDDILTGQERAATDEHLARCPLCRVKLSDFQALRQDLRALNRPAMPADLLASLRNRVAEEIESENGKPRAIFTEDVRRWLQMRLMPYSVATVVTLVFGFGLLWTLLSGSGFSPEKSVEIAKAEPFQKSTVLLADNNSLTNSEDAQVNTADFAAMEMAMSGDSPTINPKGALIALTKSIVRGKMKDDEVVVVADVFGNGLAQIAEIVEPSGDRRAVRELEKALNSNPDYAPPFLPANIDNRSETVRVILKINRVDIQTHTKTRKQ